MKSILLAMTLLAASSLVACASDAQSDEETHTDAVATDHAKTDPSSGIQIERAQSPQTCSSSQWQQAKDDAIAKHTLAAGPRLVAVPTVTSCSYNPSTGYIVYTWTYA